MRASTEGADTAPAAPAPLTISPVTSLPDRLAVGRGTALFIDGCCSHPSGPIRRLSVIVGDREHRALGWEMPPPGALSGGEYWWAIAPIEPVDRPQVARIGLRAELAGGTEISGGLGAIELMPDLVAPAEPSRNGRPVPRVSPGDGATENSLVAICMATYEPPIELFRRQVDSIRAQTHTNWVCLISDDASSPQRVEAMRDVLGDDERFLVSLSPRRLGFYSNFERALTMVPADARFVALCDQDDRWREDKLEVLIRSLAPGSMLAYSDMRIVDREGEVISDTYWTFRRNNYTDFASLLVANTITGAAAVFERSLLDDVLPFPPRQGPAYHDHWIAQVALALGNVSYVDVPLYDYVQHGGAALGHAGANAFGRHGPPTPARIKARLARLRRDGYRAGWRALYFDLYCRIALAARVLEMRCGERIAPEKMRTLARISESRRTAGWLAMRTVRSWVGQNETLGRERAMLSGLAWRRFVEERKRFRRLKGRRGAGAMDAAAAVRAAQSSPKAPDEWLTPILVDYFTRDGSTLMMGLLATSPEIAMESAYPFERKYFAYLLRWAQLVDRWDWPEEQWGARDLGSLSQLQHEALVGPPPWQPRELIESQPGEQPMSRHLFDLTWREFSRRAARRTRADHGNPETVVRYYAEKHLNTWLVDLGQLPRVRLLVLLRDPRDTWVSINAFNRLRGDSGLGRDRTESDEGHLLQIIGRQRARLTWIARLLDADEVPVVRYEDLVLDIGGVASRLGSWLGVELDPSSAAADRQTRSRHVSAGTPEASIGRWRRELEPEIAEIFARELEPELRAVGLEP